MKNCLSRLSKLGFVVVFLAGLLLSGCNEDVINPDSSAMPPKNTIKTPPTKD